MGTVWVMFVFLNLFPMSKRAVCKLTKTSHAGNAGYFALVWLWERFEPKTKLPKIEKGVAEPSNKGVGKNAELPPTCINDDVIKNVDFFHHVSANGTVGQNNQE